MSNLLKISVLTPSFNSCAYLARAIESVMAQNYSNFEHIIIDGGSTDASVAILKSYVHLTWVSEIDRGQCDAMNKAFRLATGDIIVYLNADDYFEPDTFSFVSNYFQQHPELDIVVGSLILLNTTHASWHHIPHIQFFEIAYHFLYSFPYNPLSYFYRRHVQDNIGDFPLEEHYAMDYWFVLRAFDRFTVGQVDRVFGTFFSDGNNKSSLKNVSTRMRMLSLDYLEKNKGLHWVIGYFVLSAYRVCILLPLMQWRIPFKYIVYSIFFSKKMTFNTFCRNRFRDLWADR